MMANLKNAVDGSFSISVSLSMEDLQQAGYEYAIPKPGDYILAVDELLEFNQKIRIISVSMQYDINGEKQQTSVTCNSLSAADKNNEADAKTSDTMNDIINGNGVIPNHWLEDATEIATKALINTQTELKFTNNGILAIDKTNANNVVIFNSAGLGVSTDGGKTFANAITGNGINATAIKTGSLRAIDIIGSTITGSIFQTIDSNGFKMTLARGEISFSEENKPVGSIATVNDAGTGKANGVAWFNLPGYSIGLNQSNAAGTKSHPLISVPTDSTYENPFWAISGPFRGSLTSTQDILWLSSHQQVIISGNNGAGNQLNVYGDRVDVLGNFTVYNGSKNAAHVTRDGLRATPAYETAESYLGDIGESNTGEQSSVTIPIDELFGDTINTDYDYQVFITPYSNATIWVEQRNSDSFVVRSNKPKAQFGWELKAKRRGYEKERLVKLEMTYDELRKMSESEGE